MVESANKFGGPGPEVGDVVPSSRQFQQQLRRNEGGSTVVHLFIKYFLRVLFKKICIKGKGRCWER